VAKKPTDKQRECQRCIQMEASLKEVARLAKLGEGPAWWYILEAVKKGLKEWK